MKTAIGWKIQAHRKLKGLTQAELAAASGLSEMSIRRYESGDRLPPISVAKKIAEALSIQESLLTKNTELDIEKIGTENTRINSDIIFLEIERAYFLRLNDYLINMTAADKDLFFRLSLAQAEEMAKYAKEHKKAPPAAPEEATEGE